MPILTKSGRVALAESLALRPLHLAWGTGDGSWTTPPAENADQTALQNEVGRRLVNEIAFAVAVLNPLDPAEIELPTGRFNRSVTPTNNLLIVTNFDFADASSSVIRELGLFAGSTVVGGLPAGQKYFLPAEVATPGRLVHLENITPIFRSPAIRESCEIVITF